jgi:hypothetical protein
MKEVKYTSWPLTPKELQRPELDRLKLGYNWSDPEML